MHTRHRAPLRACCFVIGTDQHYSMPPAAAQRWEAAVLFLNQLPEGLARKIGYENAMSIYRLGSTPPTADRRL